MMLPRNPLLEGLMSVHVASSRPSLHLFTYHIYTPPPPTVSSSLALFSGPWRRVMPPQARPGGSACRASSNRSPSLRRASGIRRSPSRPVPCRPGWGAGCRGPHGGGREPPGELPSFCSTPTPPTSGRWSNTSPGYRPSRILRPISPAAGQQSSWVPASMMPSSRR